MPKTKKSTKKTTKTSKKTKSASAKKMTLKPKKKTTKKTTTQRKKKKVSAIPKGYHAVTPYLIVNDAAKAIEFYKKIFAAKELMRMEQPSGKIGHSELKIGDAKIMLADECPEMDARSPQAYGGSPMGLNLYVKDVDHTVQRALAAGAKLTRAVEDMFYGDRSGGLEDPFGHRWFVATHIEDVSPATIRKRAAELFGKK